MNSPQNPLPQLGRYVSPMMLVLFAAMLLRSASSAEPPITSVGDPKPTATPTPAPTLTPDESAAIEKSKESRTAAVAVVTLSKTKDEEAKTHTKAIKDASIKADETLSNGALRDLKAKVEDAKKAKIGAALVTQIKAHASDSDLRVKLGASKAKIAELLGKATTEIGKTSLKAEGELLDKLIADFDEQKTKLPETKTAYTDAIKGARTGIAAMLTGTTTKVGETLAGTDEASLRKFTTDLKTLNDGFRLHKIVTDDYGNGSNLLGKDLNDLLKEAGLEADKDDAVVAALGTLNTKNEAQFPKLADYYVKVGTYVLARNKVIQGLTERLAVSSDVRISLVPRSLSTATQARVDLNAAQSGIEAAETLGRTVGVRDSLASATTANDLKLDQLVGQIRNSEPYVAALQEFLNGNRTNWIGDQVTLYYFGEVERLMRSLNPEVKPVGGLAEVQENARKARLELQKAELDLQDAQDNISKLQIRKRDLEAELKDSETAFKRLGDLVVGLRRAKERLTERHTKAQEAVTTAEAAAGNNAADPKLKAAREKFRLLDAELKREGEKFDDTDNELTVAKARYTELRSEKVDLPKQISDATAELIAEQGKLRNIRRQTTLLAQDDLEKFASARDNTPFLLGAANHLSTDPIKRVEIYAYADSKTLFLRGEPNDVARAKDLIAIFDRPTPQARLTLWTLEMNGQVNGKDAEKFNQAIERVEERLADTRARLQLATSILRDCLNKEVNVVIPNDLKGRYLENTKSASKRQLARYYIYNPEVIERLSLPSSNGGTTKIEDFTDEQSAFLRSNLPDPAATTTFGEALMVLALSTRVHQRNVLINFQRNLNEQMKPILTDNSKRKLNLLQRVEKKSDGTTVTTSTEERYPHSDVWFSSLEAALGLTSVDSNRENINLGFSDLTDRQSEILQALKRVALQRLVNDFQRYDARVETLMARNQNALGNSSRELKSLAFDSNDGAELQELTEDFKRELSWIAREYPELNINSERIATLLAQLPINISSANSKFLEVKAANKIAEEKSVAAESAAKQAWVYFYAAESKRKKAIEEVDNLEDAFKKLVMNQKGANTDNTIIKNVARKVLDSVETIQQSVTQELPAENQPTQVPVSPVEPNSKIQESFGVINNNLGALLKNRKPNVTEGPTEEDLKKAKKNLEDAINSTKKQRSITFAKETERKKLEAEASKLREEADELTSQFNLMQAQLVEVFSLHVPRIATRISPDATNARIAAADQMLKEIITAAEDDLDRHFVRPMFSELRRDVQAAKVNVGVLNRTSVLASNRHIARVDPSANAQLTIGKDTDLIEATRQLATIVAATQVPGVASVVNALDAQPTKETSKIYGVTSGAKFEVTPVIDPSGQALRFKFDYVLQNAVREPDGSIDPQLPRVARHTVNTEVQLSNLEIRNISQFDANAQLGIPTKRSGGIPILNDIDGLRDLPIIGWFKKREGRAAVVQQSVILAQTTIYPTIGDIAGLLSPTTARSASLKSNKSSLSADN